MSGHPLSEVYYEFIQANGAMKVSAIDVATGVEVSIIGSLTVSQKDLERIAFSKLCYVLKKLGMISADAQTDSLTKSAGRGVIA